jgi:hypothetical protein
MGWGPSAAAQVQVEGSIDPAPPPSAPPRTVAEELRVIIGNARSISAESGTNTARRRDWIIAGAERALALLGGEDS